MKLRLTRPLNLAYPGFDLHGFRTRARRHLRSFSGEPESEAYLDEHDESRVKQKIVSKVKRPPTCSQQARNGYRVYRAPGVIPGLPLYRWGLPFNEVATNSASLSGSPGPALAHRSVDSLPLQTRISSPESEHLQDKYLQVSSSFCAANYIKLTPLATLHSVRHRDHWEAPSNAS